MTNIKGRKQSIKLDFLEKGDYIAEIYKDAKDTDQNPNHLEKEIVTVTKKDVLEIPLASNGGATIHLRKK